MKNNNIYTDINSNYLNNNPNWHVEDSHWKAKQIMRMLTRNPLELGTVVEIGCGAGEILNQLHASMSNNVNFYGFDISVDAIRLCEHRNKDRLEFFNQNLLEINVKYDLLLMMDVFEHVEDYFGFFKVKQIQIRLHYISHPFGYFDKFSAKREFHVLEKFCWSFTSFY